MALRRLLLPFVLLFALLPPSRVASAGGDGGEPAEFEIPRDGTVVELNESNFDAVVRAMDSPRPAGKMIPSTHVCCLLCTCLLSGSLGNRREASEHL